jgi:hypothetical protein
MLDGRSTGVTAIEEDPVRMRERAALTQNGDSCRAELANS